MDNIVTMNLEEYTKLVIENANLKFKLNGLKKKAIDKAFEEIRDSSIDRIQTIDACQSILTWEVDKLLGTYASSYSWTWSNISADTYGVLQEQEIKELVADEIKKRVNYRCKELIEEEKEKGSEE